MTDQKLDITSVIINGHFISSVTSNQFNVASSLTADLIIVSTPSTGLTITSIMEEG